MTAQPIAEPVTAVVDQLRVQRLEARRPRHRHQVVPPDPADQSLDLALVVALAGAAEPILEQVVRLQLAEHPRPLPRPVAQNPGYGNPGVVVEDRVRHAAEEVERRGVARAERLRRLRRIGLHEAGVAVRQVHREEVDLLLHPADLRQRFAKVGLGMSRLMAAAARTPPAAAAGARARSPSRSSARRRSRARPEAARRSASRCAAASPDGAYPPPGSGR